MLLDNPLGVMEEEQFLLEHNATDARCSGTCKRELLESATAGAHAEIIILWGVTDIIRRVFHTTTAEQ